MTNDSQHRALLELDHRALEHLSFDSKTPLNSILNPHGMVPTMQTEHNAMKQPEFSQSCATKS